MRNAQLMKPVETEKPKPSPVIAGAAQCSSFSDAADFALRTSYSARRLKGVQTGANIINNQAVGLV